MLSFLRSLFSSDSSHARGGDPAGQLPDAPAQIHAPGVDSFDFTASLQFVNELPAPDWQAVSHWVESIPGPAEQATAWSACESAWLQHLRAALGPSYRILQDGDAVLLSTLDRSLARAAVEFMNRIQGRITRVLDGIAAVPEWGKDILIVFDDHESYYRYASRYDHEDGEFAGSSGMYIGSGCSHFVTTKADLREVEPVIAHEMTHGCLAHLPIPAWLNEGIAVNTEQRLCPRPRPLLTPQEMHEKHLKFWGHAEIQEFWSGKSFLRPGDANMLSYDLARILVEQFSSPWESFRAFVLAANLADAGACAARQQLDVDLGAAIAAILECDSEDGWSPAPTTWNEAPEKGAF